MSRALVDAVSGDWRIFDRRNEEFSTGIDRTVETALGRLLGDPPVHDCRVRPFERGGRLKTSLRHPIYAGKVPILRNGTGLPKVNNSPCSAKFLGGLKCSLIGSDDWAYGACLPNFGTGQRWRFNSYNNWIQKAIYRLPSLLS